MPSAEYVHSDQVGIQGQNLDREIQQSDGGWRGVGDTPRLGWFLVPTAKFVDFQGVP